MGDDIWVALQATHFNINVETPPRNTDKNYSRDLQAGKMDGDWETFYQAIDALERGCGHKYFKEIESLCQKAIDRDALRLLKILEEKQQMIDLYMLLCYVDSQTVLHWIEAEAISKVDTLFECLRKILQNRQLPEREQGAVATGMLRLSALSPARFQYLLGRYVLFREDCILTVQAMLPKLTEDGWSALSACVPFEDINGARFDFWTKCAVVQKWETIGERAEPLLRAWYEYLGTNPPKGRGWRSLYNDVSNLLIDILLCKVDTPEACARMLEKIVDQTEQAMYRWYESSSQQSDAFLAGLSQFEHMRLVWQNLGDDAPLLPTPLRQRALQLILRWRYLWDSPSNEGVCKEIEQLMTWLK